MNLRLSMLAALVLSAAAWPQGPAADPAEPAPGAPPFIREAAVPMAKAGAQAVAHIDRVRADHRYLKPKLVEIAQEHFQSEEIPIEMPDLPAMRVRKRETKQGRLGGTIWRGESPDSRWDHSTFVIRNGNVTGTIRSGGRLFTVFPAGNGLHVLAEVDQSKIVEDPPPREKNQNVEPR